MDESPDFRRRSKSGQSSPMTGYVPMDEDRLQYSGVRGGKSYCLCVCVGILLVVALLNAMVTAGLIYLMSFKLVGMESLEFLPEHNVVRIMKNLSVDTLDVQNVSGAEEVDITAPVVQLETSKDSKVYQDENRTVFHSADFELTSASGKSLFATNVPFNLDEYQVTNLHASQVEVGSIKSGGRYDGLHVESFKQLTLVGMEGVKTVSDSQIKLTTGKHIILTSSQGAVSLEGEDGISLGKDLPVEGKAVTDTEGQFKLCVCMPSGKVFSVPIRGPDSGCHTLNEDIDPCED